MIPKHETHHDEVELLQKLAKVRPDLAFDQPYEVRQGREAVVFIFETDVVRFQKEDHPDIKHALLEKEITDKMAGQEHYMVPVFSYLRPDGSMTIQNRMPGDVIIQEDGPDKIGALKISKMSPDDKQQFVKGVASFMAYLHNKSRTGEISYNLNTSETLHIDSAKSEIKKFLNICPDQKLKESLSGLLTVPEDKDTVLLHSDLNAGNIFYDSNKKSVGIIDFGLAAQGPASADLAYFIKMPQELYISIVNEYNQRSTVAVDYRQPLAYNAALWSQSYMSNPDNPDMQAYALAGLKHIADILRETKEPKSVGTATKPASRPQSPAVRPT